MKMMFNRIIVLLTILFLSVYCDDQVEVNSSKTKKACRMWQEMTGVTNGEVPNPNEFLATGVLGVYFKDSFEPFAFQCAAHLISHNFLLTAGHCVDGSRNETPIFVRFTLNYKDDTIIRKDYSIKKVFLPPYHKNLPKLNSSADLALLELEHNVKFDSNIKPICLLTEDLQFDYSQFELYVAGYGPGFFASDGKKSPDRENPEFAITSGPLRKLQVKVVAKAAPATLKVSPAKEGTTCTGTESGSIEVRMFSHVNVLIGILSTGVHLPKSQCGVLDTYVDVTKHTEWFDKIAFNDF